MTIEEILGKLYTEKNIMAVIMVKANVNYSVVPVSKKEYSTFILKDHINDKTIKKALTKLLKGGLK